jgi:hypothetical protein
MNRRVTTILVAVLLLGVAILLVSFARRDRAGSGTKVSATEKYVDSTSGAGERAKAGNADLATASIRMGTNESAELAALKSALLEPLEDERHRKFLEALSRMRAIDAPAVAELLLQLKKFGRKLPVESAAFWRRWGELDPTTALTTLTTWQTQGSEGGVEMIEWIFQGWAATSPDGAIEWLNNHGQDPNFEPAFLGFLDRYAVTDLNAATKLTLGSFTTDDPLLGKALNRLCNRVYEQSSAVGLKQWYSELPSDGKFRLAKEGTANNVYYLLARQDLNTAMDWLRSESDTAGRSKFVMMDLAIRYGAVDPPAAMDLMASLPGTVDSHWPGVGNIIRQWIRTDVAGFERWLEEHKGTPVFQDAAHDYAQIIAATDKEKARVLAGQLVPVLRDAIMRRLNGEPPPNWVTREKKSPEELAQRFGVGSTR